MYSIIPLHEGENAWLAEIRTAVSAATRTLQLGSSLVSWTSSPEENPDAQMIVVYLASKVSLTDAIYQRIRDCLSRGLRVIPVLRAGSKVSDVVPEELRIINAVWWEGTGQDAVRSLLDALGIIEHQRKVFISYRRNEGDWIANQLWEALSRARFDVFLDRFSVPPGENFQAILDCELSDKAFVVVVESLSAAKSPWVEHEVAYAHAHFMGVLALTLPGVTETARFSVIDDAFRVQLTPEQLRNRRHPAFLRKALGGVVGRIQAEHAKVLRRRRATLLGSAKEYARRAGWTVGEIAEWVLVLQHGGRAHTLLQVTPRTPSPTDLWRLSQLREQLQDSGRLSPPVSAKLVHYSGRLDDELSSILGWIAHGRNLELADLTILPGVL